MSQADATTLIDTRAPSQTLAFVARLLMKFAKAFRAHRPPIRLCESVADSFDIDTISSIKKKETQRRRRKRTVGCQRVNRSIKG